MRVLDPGHKYALKRLESQGEEILTFVKRSGGPAQYDEEWSGTTTQEVIRALIDRTTFVDALLPCWENTQVLQALRSALWWLEKRAYLRKQQKLSRVNDKHNEFGRVPFSLSDIEECPVCDVCGHIFCDEHTTARSSPSMGEEKSNTERRWPQYCKR